MTFDVVSFAVAAVPLLAGGYALVGLAKKAFDAPSKEQHQAQADLLQQALTLLAQLAGAAAQAVKPDAKMPGDPPAGGTT
jgi:hypothetical protein